MNELLKTLCSIHAPSGDEQAMTEYLLNYIQANKKSWKVSPEVYHGTDFQHCIILVFGTPRTAVFAHIDNIGFTVRYGKQLVKIGGPHVSTGILLTGKDSKGSIECMLNADDEEQLTYDFEREIDRGTTLNFKSHYRADATAVESCYLDNRLGVYVSLKLCETLEHGIIIFSCWEEHHGGSVPFLAKFIYDRYQLKQALICDITWITEGVEHGKGVVVSMRDSGIPRQVFVRKIIQYLEEGNIPFQLEVEKSGGSDGSELQRQPYPIDWCFIGAGEDFVHTPHERVFLIDIEAMIQAYSLLMKKL